MMSMMLEASWFRETRYVLSNWLQALLFFGIPVITIANMAWNPYTAVEKMLYTVSNYVAWSGGFLLVSANSSSEDRAKGIIELIVQSGNPLWSYSLGKSLFYGCSAMLTQIVGTVMVAVIGSWRFDWNMMLLVGMSIAVQLLTVLCGGQLIMAATIMNRYMGVLVWGMYSYALVGLSIVTMSPGRPLRENMTGLIIIGLVLMVFGTVLVQAISRRFSVPVLCKGTTSKLNELQKA
ncbi:hypothetical protein [Bifidobacterium aesculapii]|uniref:hypothetical protein n=1 Tax=Bifidobacterium aesculapii TaxID=1329411 RepID=UPI0006E1AB93|nr:hypothetical protein [Bifidobacterium aesculapii]